jgi:hypothetical protein
MENQKSMLVIFILLGSALAQAQIGGKTPLKRNTVQVNPAIKLSQIEFKPTLKNNINDLLKLTEKSVEPIGYQALAIYNERKTNSFADNIQFSNQWIVAQIKVYDESKDASYKEYNQEMIDGGGPEKALGVRNWLGDKENVAYWDNAVKNAIGEDGYAKLIALNAAFAPSDKSNYRLIYGGIRAFDAKTNTFSINGSKVFDSQKKLNTYVTLSPKRDGKDYFNTLMKLAHPVRDAVFQFYSDFQAGKVSADKVRAFNKAYLVVGGCAMASTDVMHNGLKANRYLVGLRYFADALTELGYAVKVQ